MSKKESARKFEFIREVAAGGFGSVYLAKVIHGDGFSRLVAIKLLHRKWSANDEVASRMRDEARLLGWLRHRNIVDVMDLTMIDGRSAVIMEYLEAVDIRVLIEWAVRDKARIPLRAALDICAAASAALDAAYNRPPYAGEKPLRVIHRDIKPSNIMVDGQGQVKVLDFGVARAEFDAREAKTAELSFGSLEYMPPERLFFEPESPASDIYSLGATLYEMLALQKLGKAKLRQGEQERFIEERFEDLLSVHPVPSEEAEDLLHDLLRDMLAFDETERPTASDTVSRLRSFARQLGSEACEEWAERVVPPLVAQQRDREITSQESLVGRVVTEDVTDGLGLDDPTDTGEGGDEASFADDVVGALEQATDQDGAELSRGRDDERWSALKQATLASLTETGELGPRTVKEVRRVALSHGLEVGPSDPPDFTDDLDDSPTVLVKEQADRVQALEGLLGDLPQAPPSIHTQRTQVHREPPPPSPRPPARAEVRAEGPGRGAALGVVAGVLMIALIVLIVLIVLVVVIGIGGTVMSQPSAPEPVPATEPAPPAPSPAPAPAPAEPVAEPTVEPLPEGEGVTFTSQLPDTAKIKVRCASGSGSGTDVAMVSGAEPGDCTVTVVTSSRSRKTAKVKPAEPRAYICFAGGSDTCE